MAFELPKLSYEYVALEPHIDAKTMEIHHSKHHQAYITNLNNAIAGTDAEQLTIEDICKNISKYSPAVRNNGGGHYNHSLFWQILGAPGTKPSAKLASAIDAELGGMDKLKEDFNKAAITRFGSGWAWLCVENGKLKICSTPNQDNPLMDVVTDCKGTPILGLDVWEHAYYLNYQNRRPDYCTAFWNVINWDEVSRRYESLI
ncbi:MAG: superoxide dismutase [Bacteroidia bacterium]|jgi:Fe-Mn family superoxide dismutase|nr:superoxide dismutase [Bacteroidia bacterium]